VRRKLEVLLPNLIPLELHLAVAGRYATSAMPIYAYVLYCVVFLVRQEWRPYTTQKGRKKAWDLVNAQVSQQDTGPSQSNPACTSAPTAAAAPHEGLRGPQGVQSQKAYLDNPNHSKTLLQAGKG